MNLLNLVNPFRENSNVILEKRYTTRLYNKSIQHNSVVKPALKATPPGQFIVSHPINALKERISG